MLQREEIPTSNRITAYGTGYIKVNEQRITSSVVVTPTQVFTDWAPEGLAALAPACREMLDRLEVEIVLLGTGASQQFPHGDLYAAAASRGIGLEVMDTAAACRTYNIVMSEGRPVAALLLPIRD